MRFLIGPSGGVSYHLAAVRYRELLWKPFTQKVESWLCETWNPNSSRLLIFGPSAGWTLSSRFLSRFESIVCVEPDPLARLLFRRRFASLKPQVKFVARVDVMPWFSAHRSPQKAWADFLADHREHAILFANLLGQLPYLCPKTVRDVSLQDIFLRELSDSDRSWASYHDILSTELRHSKHRSHPLSSPGEIAPELAAADNALALLAESVFPEGCEVNDHETLWLSRLLKTKCALWQLRPGAHQLIGFVHS